MSRIVTNAHHRRLIYLMLVLFLLYSLLPSLSPQSILRSPTLRPDLNPAQSEQGNDQALYDGDIWSQPAALTWPERAEMVKAAFVHAYVGYKTYAFGMDELKSISNGGVNK
jgi:hypothetical protein